MVSGLKIECSFSSWYPQFYKNSLKAIILHIPNEVLEYLEHDAFLLPAEVTNDVLENAEWTDGSPVVNEEVDLK